MPATTMRGAPERGFANALASGGTSVVMRAIASTLTLVALLALSGCGIGTVVDTIRDLTPHERYAKALTDSGLEGTAMGREWLAAADSVLRHATDASLPLSEVVYYDRSQARAVAWKFSVRDGQRVVISIAAQGQPAQLFSDLYSVQQAAGDSGAQYTRLQSAVTDSAQHIELRHETRVTAGDSITFVLRVQPELLRSGRYDITVRSEPVLGFPVQGRGNSAAQSFFGANRDGGARSHAGVDIFAPRGTPVVAAIDGRIASLRPNKLGGNVVWLADEARGQSLYYAHLDSQAVQEGQLVQMGDTIGFVGNTGNARTTAPHLHFGIYRRGKGAIDPWPYVRRNNTTAANIRADTTRLGQDVLMRGKLVTLRAAPSARAGIVAIVGGAPSATSDTAMIVGAAGAYFRVELRSGTAGYVPASAALKTITDVVTSPKPSPQY